MTWRYTKTKKTPTRIRKGQHWVSGGKVKTKALKTNTKQNNKNKKINEGDNDKQFKKERAHPVGVNK